jgi:hypothetical protein
MKQFPSFQSKTKEDATPGSLYGFMNQGTFHLGFLIVLPNTTGSKVFISIVPGAPRLGSRPGIVGAEHFGEGALICFDDARIRLPFGQGTTHTGKEPNEIAGAIVLIGGALGIAALVDDRDDSKGEIFNFVDGKRMERKKQFHPYFPSWSIETKDDDGTWKKLFAFTLEE